MYIARPHLNHFRNAEHYQYMVSSNVIFTKYEIDPDNLQPCYTDFSGCIRIEEMSMAAEKNSEKIRQKNEADKYRDRLHSRLFHYVKSITCDDRDPNIESARAVMKVIQEVGNPSHLAENAASAVINTLLNRLSLIKDDAIAIGADNLCESLYKANEDFIALEEDCREIISDRALSEVPTTKIARKQTDAAYRILINAINGYAGIPAKKESCRNLIAEMNTLVAKYNALIAGRGTENEESEVSGNSGGDAEEGKE